MVVLFTPGRLRRGPRGGLLGGDAHGVQRPHPFNVRQLTAVGVALSRLLSLGLSVENVTKDGFNQTKTRAHFQLIPQHNFVQLVTPYQQVNRSFTMIIS